MVYIHVPSSFELLKLLGVEYRVICALRFFHRVVPEYLLEMGHGHSIVLPVAFINKVAWELWKKSPLSQCEPSKVRELEKVEMLEKMAMGVVEKLRSFGYKVIHYFLNDLDVQADGYRSYREKVREFEEVEPCYVLERPLEWVLFTRISNNDWLLTILRYEEVYDETKGQYLPDLGFEVLHGIAYLRLPESIHAVMLERIAKILARIPLDKFHEKLLVLVETPSGRKIVLVDNYDV